MLDKINFGKKISDSKVDSQNFAKSSSEVSFKDVFEKFDNQLACHKKQNSVQQSETTKTNVPSYYYPNVNVVKYGLPPQEPIAKPMYAVPSPEIKNDKEEEPPVLKYAVPYIPNDKKDDEPPVLKYAIPGRF